MSFSEIMTKHKHNNDIKHTFIQTEINFNRAKDYGSNLLTCERNRFDIDSYKKLLNNSCVYLPNFVCEQNDNTIFNKLKEEIKEQNYKIINWNKHYKIENPQGIKIFEEIINKIATYMNVKIKASRINYYANGSDWKQYHKDSHKYVDGEKEDITIGLSFGASRELSFLHIRSNNKFSFPQNNGDLFAFTDEVNNDFKHGVPKTKSIVGERFSIIIWCKQIISIKNQKFSSKLI